MEPPSLSIVGESCERRSFAHVPVTPTNPPDAMTNVQIGVGPMGTPRIELDLKFQGPFHGRLASSVHRAQSCDPAGTTIVVDPPAAMVTWVGGKPPVGEM